MTIPARVGCRLVLAGLLLATGCSRGSGPIAVLPGAPEINIPERKATITVTSAKDSGPGTLRSIVAAAKPGSTIIFALKKKATISLTSGAIVLKRSVTISGPGATNLEVSASNRSQVFIIDAHATVSINGLTFAKGAASQGGAILNSGSLKLKNDTFSRNAATGATQRTRPNMTRRTFDGKPRRRGGRSEAAPRAPRITEPLSDASNGLGGAIYNAATLSIANSIFVNNSVQQGNGGAIYNAIKGRLTVLNTTFSKNQGGLGGAIYNAGTAKLTSDTFKGNTGWSGSGAPRGGIRLRRRDLHGRRRHDREMQVFGERSGRRCFWKLRYRRLDSAIWWRPEQFHRAISRQTLRVAARADHGERRGSLHDRRNPHDNR